MKRISTDSKCSIQGPSVSRLSYPWIYVLEFLSLTDPVHHKSSHPLSHSNQRIMVTSRADVTCMQHVTWMILCSGWNKLNQRLECWWFYLVDMDQHGVAQLLDNSVFLTNSWNSMKFIELWLKMWVEIDINWYIMDELCSLYGGISVKSVNSTFHWIL